MTPMRTMMVTALCALLAPMGLCAGEFPDAWTWDDTPDLRAEHAALEGRPMPALQVTGWINGAVDTARLKGKVVIVDFYATWCGPCMRAIPHNNELLGTYGDRGLVVLGVCTSSRGQDQMARVVTEREVAYPTARDPGLLSEAAWHVHYYPTYAVVDRNGVVRAIGLQPEYVEEFVRKLLAEKP